MFQHGKQFDVAFTVRVKRKSETKALKILWWKHWVGWLQPS